MTNNNKPGNLLVFVHIPKTAGTTVMSILGHRHSPDAIHEIMMRGMSLVAPRHALWAKPLVSASKLRRLRAAVERRDGLGVIHGHFDLSLARLLPADAVLATLLRDPVERAISHYCHYRKPSSDAIHPMAMRASLTEWVNACGLVEMDNGQTRRLAGAMNLPIGAVTSATLDKAKANLASRFSVIGLSERFEEFQVLLHRKFGWPYCRYPARNVGDNRIRRTEVSAEALTLIEDCNRFDRELYRFASDLFEADIARLDMDRELALLRMAPEYVEPPRPRPEPGPSRHPDGIPATLKSLFSAGTFHKVRRRIAPNW